MSDAIVKSCDKYSDAIAIFARFQMLLTYLANNAAKMGKKATKMIANNTTKFGVSQTSNKVRARVH